MPHYVYKLYSERFVRYYVGSCQKIEERLLRHNAGATTSTMSYRPWQVVYSEKYETKTEAINRELEIKKKKSRKYIETLIKVYYLSFIKC